MTPAESARPTSSRSALCNHAAAVAAEHDLPAPFFANLIQQESGFKSHVVSPAGAQGIAQFMPRVARAYGLHNPFDPLHSLTVSARFLRELLSSSAISASPPPPTTPGPGACRTGWRGAASCPRRRATTCATSPASPAERWARVNAKNRRNARLPAHARCPGMPVIEVSVPEAAPRQAGEGRQEGRQRTRRRQGRRCFGGIAEARRRQGGRSQDAQVVARSLQAAPGKPVAVIKNGKIQIMVEERGKKAAATKLAAREHKAPAKVAAKAAKSESKVAAKSAKPGKAETKIAAKKATTKVAAKEAAKPAGKSKQAGGKGTKLAAAR